MTITLQMEQKKTVQCKRLNGKTHERKKITIPNAKVQKKDALAKVRLMEYYKRTIAAANLINYSDFSLSALRFRSASMRSTIGLICEGKARLNSNLTA